MEMAALPVLLLGLPVDFVWTTAELRWSGSRTIWMRTAESTVVMVVVMVLLLLRFVRHRFLQVVCPNAWL
jgi:hypothetical protein